MKTSLMARILAGETSILVRKKGRLAAACALVLLPFTGCISPEEKAMRETINAVMDQMHGDCLADHGLKKQEVSIFAGPTQNGMGVAFVRGRPAWDEIPVKALVYWCQDGQIYVVNDAARECSPHLPPSPPEISAKAIWEDMFD